MRVVGGGGGQREEKHAKRGFLFFVLSLIFKKAMCVFVRVHDRNKTVFCAAADPTAAEAEHGSREHSNLSTCKTRSERREGRDANVLDVAKFNDFQSVPGRTYKGRRKKKYPHVNVC